MKRVRKKESSVILASQNLEDFAIPGIAELTKPLFSIPTHAFLFNAGNIDKKFYMDTLQLEESEYNLIRFPQRGVCLYKCGNERYNLMSISYGTNGMPDVGADGMYNNATVKGDMSTMPDTPGLAVWHSGHIGVYIGNGEVIEAMGTKYGVVKTQLSERSWTAWLQVPYINYISEEEATPWAQAEHLYLRKKLSRQH